MRVLHLEGSLFFGAAGELSSALDGAVGDEQVKALVVRLKRTHGLDFTTAQIFARTAQRLRARGCTLILVGMRPAAVERLTRTGVADVIGADNLFPTEIGWFVAMDHALSRALALTGAHDDHAPCPLHTYLETR